MRNTIGISKVGTDSGITEQIQLGKRGFFKWVPPVVVTVLLPTHATEPCAAGITAKAMVPSKCAGQPPFGQAPVAIYSDTVGVDVKIQSISHNAPGTDTITLPAFPATASTTTGVGIVWEGPASDAITCLPLSTITITVNYTCGEDPKEKARSFNLNQVLASAIP